MSDCIFCRIVAGEVPATFVHQDEHTVAFMDIGHVNPGHTIVATRAHADNIYGLSDTQAAAVFRAAARIARAAKAAFGPAGMTLLQANEPAGWQTVAHFHLHVLPRHDQDGATLTWPAKHPPREEIERHAAQLREAMPPP